MVINENESDLLHLYFTQVEFSGLCTDRGKNTFHVAIKHQDLGDLYVAFQTLLSWNIYACPLFIHFAEKKCLFFW